LAACYVASRTTGIPLLDPDPEALDAVGVSTVAIELVGVVFTLGRSPQRPPLSSASLRGGGQLDEQQFLGAQARHLDAGGE
jgi:hypothetical protein